MIVEFSGQSARDGDNIAANPSRLVNVYREPVPGGGKTRYTMKSVLGMASHATVPGVGMRALERVEDDLWQVSGGNLYQIDADGSVASIGAIDDSEETGIAGNNGIITVVGGGKYYTWNGTSLVQPTADEFSDFGSVAFLSGYTILTELDGRQFCWSDLSTPGTLTAANHATAEATDEPLIRAMEINGLLWLFKARSIEIWGLTGLADENAFERLPGAVIETGTRGYGTLTRIPSGAFFVSEDGRAYITTGTSVQPVSIPAVETAIKVGNPRCFFYEDEGHAFCVIRFDSAPAWAYDLATGEWHERAEGVDLAPWSAVGAARLGRTWYVSNDAGDIARLSRKNSDIGKPLVRQMTSRPAYEDAQRFTVREFEALGRMGFADIGREAKVMLQTSRNGGITWGPPRERSMGYLGQYGQRAVFRNLGLFRTAVFRMTVTDPADLTLNADVRVSV